MARDREIKLTFTVDGSKDILVRGEMQISVQGDFGSGTLSHFPLTSEGVGVAEKILTSAEDYASKVQNNRFTLASSTNPDLTVILIPIIPHRTG